MACPFCHHDHNWTIEEALDRLAKGPALVRAALANPAKDELAWAPAPGKWSPKQVVVHLLDTELVYGVRARKILSEDDGVLLAYDQDRWAAACTDGREAARAMDTFEALRADNIGLFRASIARMDRTGIHPEYGKVSLRDLLLHLSPHDEKHAAQIRRAREAYRDITR